MECEKKKIADNLNHGRKLKNLDEYLVFKHYLTHNLSYSDNSIKLIMKDI